MLCLNLKYVELTTLEKNSFEDESKGTPPFCIKQACITLVAKMMMIIAHIISHYGFGIPLEAGADIDPEKSSF